MRIQSKKKTMKIQNQFSYKIKRLMLKLNYMLSSNEAQEPDFLHHQFPDQIIQCLMKIQKGLICEQVLAEITELKFESNEKDQLFLKRVVDEQQQRIFGLQQQNGSQLSDTTGSKQNSQPKLIQQIQDEQLKLDNIFQMDMFISDFKI